MLFGPKTRVRISENINSPANVTEENEAVEVEAELGSDIDKLLDEFNNNESLSDAIDMLHDDVMGEQLQDTVASQEITAEEMGNGVFTDKVELGPKSDANLPKPPASEPAPTVIEASQKPVETDATKTIPSPIIDDCIARPISIISPEECSYINIPVNEYVEFHQDTTQQQLDDYIAENRYIKYLDLSFAYKLDNLDCLRGMESLEQLNLTSLNITDFNFLATLPNLKVLCLNNTEINNLQPLTPLDKLEYLGLVGIKIRSLLPLADKYNLKEINFFACTDVVSLDQLQDLVEMRNLDLELTAITDLSPISHFYKLTGLSLDNCPKIDDFSFIKDLVNLRYFSIQNDSIILESNLEYFSNLVNLNILFLLKKGISNLKYFSSMTKLRQLNLSDNVFSDLSPLENLEGLQKLKISGNKNLKDLSPLHKMKKLDTLEINGSKKTSMEVADISVLKYLETLDTFASEFNIALKDITPIGYCEKMEEISLKGCMNLEHVEVLKGLKNILRLDVSLCPKIRDLSCIKFLSTLEELNFNGTLVQTEKLFDICKYYKNPMSLKGNDAGMLQKKVQGTVKRRAKVIKARGKYEKLES